MGENTKKIEIPYAITVRDLAKLLQTNSIQVIKVLMANGVMANINQMIDYDTAAVVAMKSVLRLFLKRMEPLKMKRLPEKFRYGGRLLSVRIRKI